MKNHFMTILGESAWMHFLDEKVIKSRFYHSFSGKVVRGRGREWSGRGLQRN